MMRFFAILILFILSAYLTSSQDYIFNSHYGFPVNEKDIYFKDINTSLRPVLGSESEFFDSLIFYNFKEKDLPLFRRKMFHEHLYVSKSEGYRLVINPIFDFRYNQNSAGNTTGFLNTRGIAAFGRLNSKIWFNTSFYENQGSFPHHIDSFYSKYNIIPGYSRIKPYKDNAYDFMTAFGNISVKPANNLIFTFGTDKNFIGDGYRSVLLSDFSCPYLFLKTSLNYKKLTFNHIISHTLNPNYHNIMELEGEWSENMAYPGKLISYNYLTWNINKNFQLGFFEAVIFDARHDKIWNYAALNPVPYMNTGIYGFDNVNNALAGLNFSYQNQKYGVVYSQFLIDKIELSKNRKKYDNRLAWQLGYKSFDFLTVKNLYFQFEYNHADALTYSHKYPTQHYGQFNQALAHPAGSGFDEFVVITKYSYKRFSVFTKLNYLQYQYAGSFDMKNIFNQEPFLKPMTIVSRGNTVIYSDSQIIFHVNKTIGLQIFGGIIFRQDLLFDEKNMFVQFGLRTALRANYYDF